ncbi:MAG: hypothetical protein JWN34_430 [Bryobacterales bacterium]|nr:hypothetical protein [Bryobacterales bacterium]
MTGPRIKRLAAIAALAPLQLLAHAGEPLQPHDLWRSWAIDPGVVLPLLISAALYAAGARRARGTAPRQIALFWSGWICLALSLVSPIHPLGEILFSAHMTQHEVMILLAAPLLVLSRPLVAFLWALPLHWRRSVGRASRLIEPVWRALTRPLNAWLIHAAALWIWHAPALFQATLTNDLVHAAQHVSFFASALLFWWSLLYAHQAPGRATALLYVFSTGVHTSILGALLTFSRSPWYPAYARTAAWGFTALEDQQLGGLIMWVPAGTVYVAAGLGMLALVLRDLAREENTSTARSTQYVR